MYSDLAKKRACRNVVNVPQTTHEKKPASKIVVQRKEPTAKQKRNIKWAVGLFIVLLGVGIVLWAISHVPNSPNTNVIMGCSGSVPKIKGFQLGMCYDEALEVARELLDKINADSPNKPYTLDANANVIALRKGKHDGSFVELGFCNEELNIIGFAGQALNLAFGVNPNNITDEQFIQLFVENYGVPDVNIQAYSFTEQNRFGVGRIKETYGFYDGSESEGYAFKFRGYSRTGNIIDRTLQFAILKYGGLDSDLPVNVSDADIRERENGIGPVIKGFQIGMKRSEVLETIHKFWSDAKPVEKGDVLSFPYNGMPGLDFWFKNGQVYQFYISNHAFNRLYNVFPQYQDFRTFAKKMIDLYGIPEANGTDKSTANKILRSYSFTMNGLEFNIEEHRSVNKCCWAIGCRKIDSSKFD